MKNSAFMCIITTIFVGTNIFSQEMGLPPKDTYPYSIRQIHSGHSLTDPLFHPWPGQYRYLMHNLLNAPWDNLGKSTIPGSPLSWRWNNDRDIEPSSRHDIGQWELLIITERVPLHYEGGNNASWYIEGIAEQRQHLSLFVNNAWTRGNNGRGAPTLLWTTWTNINHADGPWRQMLDTLEDEWEKMQDHSNANRPQGAPPVYIIPGHKMMARLYDDIAANRVPGITNIGQFFSDNIHLNDLGSYAMALIHYACVFNKSPEGLSNNFFDSQTRNVVIPSQQLANYLQKMIWEVVTTYPRTGITADMSTSTRESMTQEYIFYPNPVTTELNIQLDQPGGSFQYRIIDMKGVVINSGILSGEATTISVNNLPTGTYQLVIPSQVTQRFVKL